MIGDKVKRLREQLGLSQQQLAGKELTRAFISLVEREQCKPSLESLRLIAERLGKPVDYFLEGDEAPVRTTETLLRSGRHAMAHRQYDLASNQLEEAIRLSQRTERLDLEAEALFEYGVCLRHMRNYASSMDALEAALDGLKVLGNRAMMATVYFELAAVAFYLEEFPLARRHYEKALRITEGSKRMQELRYKVHLYLGTVLMRMGELDAAVQAYQQCLSECDKSAYPAIWGEALMGKGVVLYRQGRLDESVVCQQQAQEVFRQIKHPQLYGTMHNLAVLEAARSRWENAYALLQQCIAVYKDRGQIALQASALEELSRYWMHKNDLPKARATLLEAIDLLDLQDDGVLRGRLYRQLGGVEARAANFERARNYLLISYELLRRLKSAEEALKSMDQLRDVEQQIHQAP